MNNDPKNSLEIGTVIDGKWVILEFIAKGGMGEVYRAHQIRLKRDVALKVISKDWLDSIAENDYERETGLKRFRNEVQAMARVRHPNVLQIFDYGTISIKTNDHDVALEYIVMEYIPGGTLRSTLSEEGFDSEEALIRSWLSIYFIPVLDGVAAIHELKMVHRDLKPENVMMDGETAKIADFGLAHSYQWEPVTQSIDVKGTSAYMSPEHFFEFDKADHRSDIYSLGKMLFEAISGRISPKAIPFKQASLSNPKTAFLQALDEIIRTATAEDREKRYDSAKQFQKAIRHAMKAGKTASPRVSPAVSRWSSHFFYKPLYIWTGIVLAIVSVAAMTLWHLMGDIKKPTSPPASQHISQMETPRNFGSTSPDDKMNPVKTPAQSILSNDGITMQLIPGGHLEIRQGAPGNRRDTVQIKPFYLDEMKVTAHHFVEFLNQVEKSLTVKDGVVKQNDKIWLYLGESTESDAQILYRHNRFHLRETKNAARPVVRVTWYGAVAYAQHFGKRLPTEYEWEYAISLDPLFRKTKIEVESDAISPKSKGASGRNKPRGHMMDLPSEINAMHSDSFFKKRPPDNAEQKDFPEKDTPKKDVGGRFKEWVTRGDFKQKPDLKPTAKSGISHPSLVAGTSSDTGHPSKTFRYPWEAFSDVGFRCVRSID